MGRRSPFVGKRPGAGDVQTTILLIVALLAVAGLAAAFTVDQLKTQNRVVQVRADISRGATIKPTDLGEITVGSVQGVSTTPANQIASLIGQQASVDLMRGSLLPQGAVGDAAVPTADQTLVGLRLEQGRMVVGDVRPGSRIRLVVTAPQGGDPTFKDANSNKVFPATLTSSSPPSTARRRWSTWRSLEPTPSRSLSSPPSAGSRSSRTRRAEHDDHRAHIRSRITGGHHHRPRPDAALARLLPAGRRRPPAGDPDRLPQGAVITPNGLLRLIDAARISPDLRDAISRQWIEIPGDNPDGLRRRLLPGLVSAQTSEALFKTWPALSSTLRDLSDTGIDTIVDVGRMDWRGIHPSLLDAATHVLLMTTPTLRAAGAATWAAQRLREQANDAGNTGKLGVVLVRPPALTPTALTNTGREERGWSDREFAAWFEIPVRGQILRDPANARVLSDGAPPGSKFTKSAYTASLSQLAQKLHH